MLFSSITFLYCFLPVVTAVYFIAPRRTKNAVLLTASLFFYYWGEPRYTALMLAVIILTYVSGIIIEKFKSAAKWSLIVSVAADLALLGYFKYADFFIGSVNSVLRTNIPLLKIALPIGISFYIFQSISYLADVYRGDVSAQKNPIALGAYIAMFPQLIAGPIVRYSDIALQLKARTHSTEKLACGVRLFVIGLSKKVLIANLLGELVSKFSSSAEPSVLFYWLYAVGFTLQIYFDFSGYSDMAIGLGKIFGFDFIRNFDYPYVSASITEFWRKWHISLGSWFRDYVYIPLGGNRVKRSRHLANILIVWALTGLWHGASGEFIVWGLYFAVLLIIEKLWLLPHLKRSRVLSHVYVLLLVTLGFVIFNAGSLLNAARQLGAMFGFGSLPLTSAESVYYLKSYAGVLIIAAVGSTPAAKKLYAMLSGKKPFAVLEPLCLAALLIVCTAYLIDGSFNPFLYFRF